MKLFIDNLTVIDCSLLSLEHGLSGMSWICDIVLTGALDSQSMVMDFGHVKKRIKQAIDARADHALLVPMQCAGLNQFDNHNGIVTLTFTDSSGQRIHHVSPESALCCLETESVTVESVKRDLEAVLMQVVNASVQSVELHLREEVIGGPSYHYSHGLKKHDGHCQRIAHGHRSKIEIYQDGELAEGLMRQWADRWPHIYIGSHEDIMGECEYDGRAYYQFAYRSGDGAFELEIAQDRCEIINSDSTVECIAGYILKQLQADGVTGRLRVKAYEGVQKGAIVES